MKRSHVRCEPAILYCGTPVVLISTINEDGTFNIAPMSSAFWLGWRCMLGLEMSSKTTLNMIRTGECVLNLPSVEEADAIDRLARLTGAYPVPASKEARGYTHEHNKFDIAGLTAVASETITPARANECPIQLEAVVVAQHGITEDQEAWQGALTVFEVRIQRVHVDPTILKSGNSNRIDPDKWRPVIMNFQKLYGLAPAEVRHSKLSEIDEAMYLSPDVEMARTVM